MRGILLTLSLLTIAYSAITCDAGKVYAKFFKVCTSSASEESYEIWSGSTMLEASPTFVNSENRTIEYCLPASTNSQYTLKLKDKYGDSWTNGAYLIIEGIDGNYVFKSLMFNRGGEEYTLSFYSGAHKNDQWRMTTGSVTGSWTEASFVDSTWTQVTLGSVSTSPEGTQYFRKTFTGLAGMAAYEFAMNYRYGIVAYVNGLEIYRDNMPEGTISSSTAASGSYSATSYRSVIRPGSEVASTSSVVAVEIHLTQGTTSSAVDFNAYLALLASSTLDNNCFVYPYDVDITSSFTTTSAHYLMDFKKTTSLSIIAANRPATFTLDFGMTRPFINGIYSYPSSSTTYAVNTFVLEATNNPTSTWSPVISAEGITYTSQVWSLVSGFFNADLFSNYRFKAVSSSSSTLYIYELHMLTCNSGIPTSIEYKQATYSYYVTYEEVLIKPLINEFVNCQITPQPPAGLTFDSATCTLTGKGATAGTTAYTVTSVINGQTFTGSFSLTFNQCAGKMISILRTYKSYGNREAFTIKDAISNTVVLDIGISSTQASSKDVEYFLCLTGQQYTLETSSSYAYWQAQSFLYVRYLFGVDMYDTILRAKYDTNLGLPNIYSFSLNYGVLNNESWSYQMGTVPANWYNTDMSSWTQTATPGNFPATSHVQLYKKTFTLASVQNAVGIVINLKYQHGVLIYLNGHEAFRLGVTGDLTATSTASTTQTEVAWRQISLPIKTFVMDNVPAVEYLVAGSNTIAIALVGNNASQTTSTFDCAVRIMGTEKTSRVYDLTVTQSGISGSPTSLHYFYYTYSMYKSACGTNYWQIQFDNDRHEWFSNVAIKLYYTQSTQQPRQFVLKAKNAADTEWTTLKTVTGMTWSLEGQENTIWIQNNKSWNMYRFEDFATGDTTSSETCYWKIGKIDLVCNAMNIEVPALSYESVAIFKDIEMAEVYPNSEYYTDFTINPPLPTGIVIDANSGTISGTATTFQASTTYTISARKYSGEPTTCSFSLSVEACHGGKNLITLVARTDSSPTTAFYSLYQGKGTSGTALKQDIGFVTASNLNYADFCLNHGIYTLALKDTTSTGWSLPGGYYLTVDVGEMKFEMGQVYTGTTPTIVTTMFSSFLPFQIEYEDWKVYKNAEAVSTNWNAVNFDDSTWTVTKAAQIGTSEAVTVYIRKDITLDDVANYHVLNVRVKYAGGVVAYFNGRKVARFNLDEEFTSSSESIAVHNMNTFSQFHIVLPTVGAVTGKNVMAFEIHRPYGQSSAEPVVFDATGVFGVNDCSLGVDTVIDITGSTFYTIGSLANFFDYTPVTYGYIANTIGNYLQWSVENLEGTRFNSFALESTYVRTSFGFSLYGRFVPAEDEEDPDAEEKTTLYEGIEQETIARARTAWAAPVGIAGFRQFRWEIDDTANSAVYAAAYILQYCKASGSGSCPGIDEYPPVGEGEISPAGCGEGFSGYSYRTCTGGTLGEISTDKCVYKLPKDLLYTQERYIVVMNLNYNIPAPAVTNIVTRFYLDKNVFLPTGLELDENTGAISGVATEELSLTTFTIFGENPSGVTSTTVSITVRKGECKAEGNFPKTTVGEIAEYECALGGNYIGTQRRACILGERDGEWQKIQGTCYSTATVVILVILVIIIVLVLAFIVMRTTKKSKAVGGVKGKKGSAAKKSAASKKASTAKTAKAVKV